ncbi:major facilitator superfamily domain-containing protein [Papiliotrema laurentii]|uniref:Major facilitator superfamily domain-containing protein n=1 Tax=Papiliotrema laurentii TaxID=5418 RepID=A0AAD9CVQ0_PAPLA|nr:major facilitator superfamily domain-containing protein [Papiliotrema laurentii]
MPFINRMVASFDTSADAISRYSGIIESSLIITEAICSPLWGIVADRRGRKPLLVFGLAAFAIASVAIGLSRSLLQAIAARCISGVLGAVAVLVRTIQFEIADDDNVGRGEHPSFLSRRDDLTPVLEWLAPTWAIGASIGPLFGGLLAEPADTMPTLFKGTIFETFPYLLPSVVMSIIPALTAIATWIWLPETLGKPVAVPSEHREPTPQPLTETTPLLSPSLSSSEVTVIQQDELDAVITKTFEELLCDARLLFALVCSAALSFVSMAYNAAFMMMASAPVLYGGLGLEPRHIGIMLAISSVLGVIVGTYGTAFLTRRFGWYRSLKIASFFHVVLFPLITLTGIAAQLESGVGPITASLILLVLVTYEIGELSFMGVDVVIGDRSPKGCLASVNGLSSTMASLGRVVAPIAAGQLWSFSAQTRFPGGRHLIWAIFTLVAITWHVLTLRLDAPSAFAKASKAFGDLEQGFGACVCSSSSNSSSVYGTMAEWESSKADPDRRTPSVLDTLVHGYDSSGLDTDSEGEQADGRPRGRKG